MDPIQLRLYERLKALYDAKTPVYLIPGYRYADPNSPVIKTIRETHGTIISLDQSKVTIAWDNSFVAADPNYGRRAFDYFFLDCINYLLSKDQWESSDEFKSLSSRFPKFSPGEIVYLSSRYGKQAGEFVPKIGSEWETHGKVLGVIFNRNRTAWKYIVRWFLKYENIHYDEADLLSAKEYSEIKINDSQQFVFAVSDPLVSPEATFIKDEKGYFKSLNDTVYVSDDFIEFFKRKK